ncbi:MAG: succinate dehydrogenase cytochrome b subunit [Muribaculaceae bacterium]|nr:succinate dehydrogenase cytochrome b subunit [Muribaculaceae bacterium]
MWLTCSSIGRKLVMAVTGVCLVLFITFHCLMNGVALFWPQGYNAVCEFLGANWYALVATVGLAALFIIHIIYALWLTVQNRKARGADRYNVVTKPAEVEWASQNMLVLGIVVLAFLVVHMIQFWAKMQLAEILGCEHIHEGVEVAPAAGTLFIQIAFSQIWTPIVYIIGFIALWFHMNHGFWSMFQSCGWNGQTWLPRLRKIACWWTTIVVALFIAEAVVFTVRANTSDFAKQYSEYNEWKSAEGLLSTDVNNAGFPFTRPCAAPCDNAPCENAPQCGECETCPGE